MSPKMRIGIISDTHDKMQAHHMEALKKAFMGVDKILHAGDIYSSYLLDQLEEIAPVIAAKGNGDFITRDDRVSFTHTLNIEGFLIHLGHYFPFHDMELYISSLKKPQDNENAEFDAVLSEHIHLIMEAPDIIIFGHTHRALVHKHEEVLLLNPGSPTVPFQRHLPGTAIILTIDNGKCSTDIIQI